MRQLTASSCMANSPSPGCSSRDWKLASAVLAADVLRPLVDATVTWHQAPTCLHEAVHTLSLSLRKA